MNLLMIPLDGQGNICNIYLLLSEAEKLRNTGLGWIKTNCHILAISFLISHYFHCNDSVLLSVLLMTHVVRGSKSAFTVVFVNAKRNRQHQHFT